MDKPAARVSLTFEISSEFAHAGSLKGGDFALLIFVPVKRAVQQSIPRPARDKRLLRLYTTEEIDMDIPLKSLSLGSIRIRKSRCDAPCVPACHRN